jgi:hypothetical protein
VVFSFDVRLGKIEQAVLPGLRSLDNPANRFIYNEKMIVFVNDVHR